MGVVQDNPNKFWNQCNINTYFQNQAVISTGTLKFLDPSDKQLFEWLQVKIQ